MARVDSWTQPPVHKSNCRDAVNGSIMSSTPSTRRRLEFPGGSRRLLIGYAQAAARAGGAPVVARIARSARPTQFCIYSASVAFLLVSMVTRDRYKDVVLISAPFLVAVAVATSQAKTPPPAASSRPSSRSLCCVRLSVHLTDAADAAHRKHLNRAASSRTSSRGPPA